MTAALDEDIAIIEAIVAWRKVNESRAVYLSGKRLLNRLKRERKAQP